MTLWMNMRTSKKHVSVHGDQLRVNSCQTVFLLISVEKLLGDGLGSRSNTVNPKNKNIKTARLLGGCVFF